MNTQTCTQLPMQICVHTLRFAQLLHAKYMHTPTDIWALNPRHPIRVPQLLPCQDPCAAEGVAAGTKAAAFLARSGLAVRATTSHHGHPLPRSSCHHSWCLPPQLVPKCFVSSLGLHTGWDLGEHSSSPVPLWGFADGEWPDPAGRPRRAGTDPCQHLQEAVCVTSACLSYT